MSLFYKIMERVTFVTAEEVQRLLLGLDEKDRDKVLVEVISKIPPEKRSHLFGLSDTGLTVVSGSFVALNSEFTINVQNSSAGTSSPAIDLVGLCQAMLEFKRSHK